MMNNSYSYLALGDSYTIGEGLPLSESFPYQAVQLFRKEGKNFQAPEILAKTGWTTGELLEHINNTILRGSYDFVTLLIGVNNQYRGQPTDQYSREFKELLEISLEKANNIHEQVTVFSIPDWSLSPFGCRHGSKSTREEIFHFNSINLKLSLGYQVNYIDITSGEAEGDSIPGSFAADGLHPSAGTYKRWAEILAKTIKPRQL